MPETLTADAFFDKWSDAQGAERANAQAFLLDLAVLLGVEPPRPTTGEVARDAYVFERPLAFQDGRQQRGYIDLYKRGAFVLETKQGADAKRTESGVRLRTGHGMRGTRAWESTMEAARNQAEGYARNLEAAEPAPPFVVVCDVGYCFDLYADFSGTGRLYRPFPDAASNRIALEDLRGEGVRERMRRIWDEPLSLDPARRQAQVTVDLARRLGRLAGSLDGVVDVDGRPMDAEAVAGFLSRCLFCMFAEDAELLPEGAFKQLMDAYADDLDHLPLALADFFGKMDGGGFVGEVRARLRRFNGQLFKDTRAPRLTAEQHALLVDAARADWSEVEPSIFGTLLERALDPEERHRLGAHFTPRAYVERLVGPTVLEPLREAWDGVRAAATQLAERAEAAGRQTERTRFRNQARDVLAAFLTRLSEVRVLDPACGSGNFLYVTFDGLKALEDEVRRASERLVGEAVGEGFGVTPRQMRGIELNARAAAVADLVLWIGYLQWHRRRYGAAQPLPEPVLEGYGQVEHRDAVLTPDGEPAAWPEADFIVGNPPFLGNKRMREALGDAYTERLREAYPHVPESADLVMYWWDRAAAAVRARRAERFGLITTNSIVQTYNRRVVELHLSDGAAPGAEIDPGAEILTERLPNPLALVFAVADHPWVDSTEGAAVRVAMTVGASVFDFDQEAGRLVEVTEEHKADDHGISEVETKDYTGRINADLTVGADVTQAEALEANEDLSYRGITRVGTGFTVTEEEKASFDASLSKGTSSIVRRYRNGSDLTRTPRGLFLIDTFGFEEDELRRQHPQVFEHLVREVKPQRDKNRRKSYRENWWIHGEARPDLRKALDGLSRYIGTPYVSKHRVFVFLDIDILPDEKVASIALEDAFDFGVLSSAVHTEWALAAGSRLGVGNDPTYNTTKCFNPFPFPTTTEEQAATIRELGEALDAHRKARQAEYPKLGLTDLYNAVEALRAGRALTGKEERATEQGLAHTLLDLHRRLDRAVLRAYGWDDLDAEAATFRAAVLGRLVALNAERRREEETGRVRYLRPAFQDPDGTGQSGLDLSHAAPEAEEAPPPRPWPETLAGQTVAVRQAVAAGHATPEAVAARFQGASATEAEAVLDALAQLGLLQHTEGAYAA